MIGFVTKSLDSETVGERLKNIRLKRGISVEEIAEEIKIKPEYLKSLEEEKYEELPADVYIHGFLRAYAQYLGIASDELILLYQKDKKVRSELRKSDEGYRSTVKPIKVKKFVITPKIILGVIAGLFILSIVGYFIYQVSEFTQAPVIELIAPSPDVKVRGETIEVVGKAGINVEVRINGQLAYIGEDGNFRQEVPLKNGLNEIIVVGKNKIGKETIITRNVILE